MTMKEESEKAGLKLNVHKIKIKASDPIASWKKEGEKVEAVTDFLFLGSKITADSDCSLVSSSPGFHVMYSAYKLNKQGDNI